MNIKKIAKDNWSHFLLERKRNWAISMEKDHINLLELTSLSSNELNEIKQTWGGLGLSVKPLFYQMFKTVIGFDPRFLSDDLYFPMIVRTLNPNDYSKSFSHKGFLPFLLKDVSQPSVIVNNIRGVLFDGEMNIITNQDAIELLKNKGVFVIKPTTGTSCGKGVQYVDINNIEESIELYLSSLLDNYGQNYIVQDVVKQSHFSSQFNPESLNTLRVTTLFINGKISVCSVVFKIGKKGGICDNLGAGGRMIGVHDNGVLWDYAFDNKYNKYFVDENQNEYNSYTIPNYQLIVDFAKHCHTHYFPHLGIVGWDIALDHNDSPLLIEANLNFPGIQFEQICVEKPIFGDRTSEVVKYVRQNTQCNV